MGRTHRHLVLTAVAFSVAITSCGGSGGSGGPGTTSAPSSSAVATTTAVASTTTTTLYTATGDRTADLRSLSTALGGVDYSKVSASSCGEFAMVVTAAGLRFFQWTAATWVEQPSAIPAIGVSAPFTVTSRDYTRDSIVDFLVRWNSADPQGSILLLNTGTCAWDWADLFNGGGTVKYLKALKWSSSTGQITAKLPSAGGAPFYDAEMVYDAPNRTFVSSSEIGY